MVVQVGKPAESLGERGEHTSGVISLGGYLAKSEPFEELMRTLE